jgi:CheY-like chemotaxis protein
MLPGEFDPSRMSALVVDDRHYERGITLDQLRALGLNRVVGAANMHEAWDLLCRINPDIVFLEWLQGDGDGLDFVRRVRAGGDAPNRAVAMFMLTARSARADVEAARRAGADGYLRKPIAALAVQRRVRKVVGNPQPFIVTESYVGPCRRRVRQGYVHAGPWRRLDDAPPNQSADEDLFDLKMELARARVAAVQAAAQSLAAGDGKSARLVYKATQSLVEVAEQIGDKNLELGAKELMRYLQAQGATERLDPNAVRIHISALHQLAHLPHALGAERDRVAESLRRMVDKKLRSATNAA